jgi:PKD repeat protein
MLGASAAARRGLPAAVLACVACLFAAPAASAGVWLSPQNLSAAGKDAIDPRVAMADSGETVAVWERDGKDPFSKTVQASTRAPGGDFSAPIDLSLPSQDPELAITPGGEAVVAWWHRQGSFYLLQASFRPPGGSFSSPADVTAVPTGSSPPEVQLAANGGGAAVLAWRVQVVPQPTQEEEEDEETPDPEAAVAASYRPAGGGFSTPEIVSPQPAEIGEFAAAPDVAVAGNGDAIVVWSYGATPPEPEELPEREIEAAVRPAGSAGFDDPEGVSEGEGYAAAPAVAMDADGNAIATWTQKDEEEATFTIRNAYGPSGAGFESPDEISEPGEDAGGPQVALTPAGAATAAWVRQQGSAFVIQASSRPPGGSFPSTPVDVTTEDEEPAPATPELALNSGNTAAVSWSEEEPSGMIVKVSIRLSGGGFSLPEAISPTGEDPFHPHIAIDGSGNATVVWYLTDGSNEIIQAAGYDASPPEIRGLSVPATGTVGIPVTFSASPFDVWPLASTEFSFGDGLGAQGTTVSHAYSAPGTYSVTATAVDAAGTPVSASGTIAISPSYEFRIGKQKRNLKKGTATLTVAIPGPGQVSVSGKKVKRKSKRAAAAGSVTLPIAAKGKARKQLNEKGKVKIRVTVAFAPDGGDHAASRAVSVTLKKK